MKLKLKQPVKVKRTKGPYHYIKNSSIKVNNKYLSMANLHHKVFYVIAVDYSDNTAKVALNKDDQYGAWVELCHISLAFQPLTLKDIKCV